MRYPDHFLDFLDFLCRKYNVDRSTILIEYSPSRPPPVQGTRPGYYDGLLSYRERNGRPEFLITVFKVAHDPLLTLAHEFAHLVRNMKSDKFDKHLSPPEDAIEDMLDNQAKGDVAEYRSNVKL